MHVIYIESTKILQHATLLDQVPNPIISSILIKVPNVDD